MAVVALVVRALHLIATGDMPFVLNPVGDGRGYLDWAARIASGKWFGTEPFYQAPLYPYVLAALRKVFGAEVGGVRVAQAAGGATASVAVAWAGARLFDRRVGLVAGVMLGLYAPAIFYDGIVQKTCLTGLLTAGCLALVAEHGYSRRVYTAALLGLCAALLALTRENALAWLLLFAVWIATVPAAGGGKRSWRALLAYGLCAGLPLAAVSARNASLGGTWSPTTYQSGSNFYIGNGAEADGLYRPLVKGHETPEFERDDAVRLAEQAEGRSLAPGEVSSYWWRRSREEISAAPGRWFALLGRKLLITLGAYEVPDVESLEVYGEFSPLLSAVSRLWHFGILLPLAGVGLVLSASRRRVLWPVYAMVVVMVAAVAAFFVLGRYRYPLVGPLIVFSAAGVVGVVDAARAGGLRRVVWPVVVALVAAVVANWPVLDRAKLGAMAYMNLGVAMAQRGEEHLPDATRYLRAAADGHPGSPEAQFNLGQALAISGDVRGAIERFRAALALRPDLVGVDFFLGQLLEQVGDREGALRHYRRAVELDPRDAEARAGVGRMGG
ncbi:MAG: tetratricopeptide repeat protein [Verrucomicrobiales bacterium]|nr:tetratricopeptide repeat protein [Verrucomicrobiales bacterium]